MLTILTSLLNDSHRPISFASVAAILRQHRLGALTVALFSLLPLATQAALPPSIEAALAKAELTADNISIIVTPVGDKATSRLPSVIKVIDSRTSAAANESAPLSPKDSAQTVNHNANQTSIAAKNNNTATTLIDKQTIEQRERNLQAYTDDLYTYQSLENPPPILVIDETTTTRRSDNIAEDTAINNQSSDSAQRRLTPLVSHNPSLPRTPASTMKLIPSFVALATLGADFVWFTRVYHTGIIIGDRLKGDLIIQGSGDPKMTHERLEQLLYRVQKTGIRHIDGDIIVDSSIFKQVSKDPAAFDNAPLRPYNASPDGFLVNFNSLGIYTYPAVNGQAPLTYTPQLANYQLPNNIATRSASCSQASNSLAPQWQQDKLSFNARLPDSCGEHIFYINYPDAKDFAAQVIASKWQTLGNTLTGTVRSQEKPYATYHNSVTLENEQALKTGLALLPLAPLPLLSYPSYNLTQQIYDINHFSNNVMTEQVALSIGSYANNSPAHNRADSNTTAKTQKATSLYQFAQPKATDYPQTLALINQWWQSNLTTAPPYLTNGSGLCRDCTLSAANLEELLKFAYSHPSFDAYVNSLGVAGVSGTIQYHSERLPDSKAIGRAWIKTGTLNNVTAMAGYVKGHSGQDYVIVGIINTEQALNPYVARPVLDTLLDWTAQQ